MTRRVRQRGVDALIRAFNGAAELKPHRVLHAGVVAPLIRAFNGAAELKPPRKT